MYFEIFGCFVFLAIVAVTNPGAASQNTYQRQMKRTEKFSNWTFKNYIDKFNPKNVWERVNHEQKLRGQNYSKSEYIDKMLDGIDPTEELLRLKVPNGDAKMLVMKDGRRWRPPPGLSKYPRDLFNLRFRLYELIKQAIYQARDRMVIMQVLRKRYNRNPLYKMGYLTSKTDQSCKTFAMVAFRALRQCGLVRQNLLGRTYLIDILLAEERLLNLWFTTDLLTDLIEKNDEICKEMLDKVAVKRVKAWKFVD